MTFSPSCLNSDAVTDHLRDDSHRRSHQFDPNYIGNALDSLDVMESVVNKDQQKDSKETGRVGQSTRALHLQNNDLEVMKSALNESDGSMYLDNSPTQRGRPRANGHRSSFNGQGALEVLFVKGPPISQEEEQPPGAKNTMSGYKIVKNHSNDEESPILVFQPKNQTRDGKVRSSSASGGRRRSSMDNSGLRSGSSHQGNLGLGGAGSMHSSGRIRRGTRNESLASVECPVDSAAGRRTSLSPVPKSSFTNNGPPSKEKMKALQSPAVDRRMMRRNLTTGAEILRSGGAPMADFSEENLEIVFPRPHHDTNFVHPNGFSNTQENGLDWLTDSTTTAAGENFNSFRGNLSNEGRQRSTSLVGGRRRRLKRGTSDGTEGTTINGPPQGDRSRSQSTGRRTTRLPDPGSSNDTVPSSTLVSRRDLSCSKGLRSASGERRKRVPTTESVRADGEGADNSDVSNNKSAKEQEGDTKRSRGESNVGHTGVPSQASSSTRSQHSALSDSLHGEGRDGGNSRSTSGRNSSLSMSLHGADRHSRYARSSSGRDLSFSSSTHGELRRLNSLDTSARRRLKQAAIGEKTISLYQQPQQVEDEHAVATTSNSNDKTVHETEMDDKARRTSSLSPVPGTGENALTARARRRRTMELTSAGRRTSTRTRSASSSRRPRNRTNVNNDTTEEGSSDDTEGEITSGGGNRKEKLSKSPCRTQSNDSVLMSGGELRSHHPSGAGRRKLKEKSKSIAAIATKSPAWDDIWEQNADDWTSFPTQ